MKDPIRYSPDLESHEDGEEETIAEMKESLRSIMRTTEENLDHAIRSVHAKAHGVLVAKVTVLPEIAPEYAQGMFAKPGTYDAVMRFSTNPGDILDDAVSVPRGLAVKVLGVDGERLPGSEGHDVQDFVLVNGPAFAAASAAQFNRNLKVLAATTDRAEWAKKGLSFALRGMEKALEAVGGESTLLQAMGGAPQTHPLGETYYSQAAFRHGDYVAKYAAFPVSPELQKLSGETLSAVGRPDALREEIDAVMKDTAVAWELRVQLLRDLETMPVEDSTVVWPEDESPFVAVARIEAPAQTTFEKQIVHDFDDRTRFSPWTGIAAHRPLGAVNRSRKETYESSAEFRAHHNGCPIRQPNALGDLPLSRDAGAAR